ncbi:MAG: ATP-dependent Clp protease proteolytic subunit [Syntrophales bacterium]|nr:ATP-dependent Clp protease proteolytic subunit [Syntrophales bacterium]
MSNKETDFPRTPLYRALQSDRYARQEAISSIEELTERQLIVYEANLWSNRSSLGEEDIQPFGDLLVRLSPKQNVDLLLQSPGGDIDAAEKIVYMCREIAGEFRVIVPEYAKSAATLIALASDEVIMGLASELGPIDAQLTGPGPGGAVFQTSAQSFIDELDRIKEEVDRTGNLSPAYFPLLEGLNLGFIRMCRNLMERSQKFAEKWLKKYMLKDDPVAAERLAAELCNVKKWLSHGVVIDADEAARLGVKVKKLKQDDDLWKQIWYLHCCYGVLFRKTPVAKIYESTTVSLPFE